MSDEGKLSPTTVHYTHQLLKAALDQAQREGQISRNVVAAIESPRQAVYQASVLDVAEAKRLLEGVRGHRLYPLWYMVLLLGLRRGEVLAVSWEDIDFESGILYVRRSLQRLDGRLQLVAPKTRASEAALHLPQQLLSLLQEHRADQAAHRLASGPGWTAGDFVFTSTSGTPIEPRNLSREWERLRGDLGLPGVRLHDLRHATATCMTAIGVHPRVTPRSLSP